MATTYNTVVSIEEKIVYTLEWLDDQVRDQAKDYLSKKPYRLSDNPGFERNFARLLKPRQPPKGQKGNNTESAHWKDVIHQDLLFSLSNQLIYRTNVIRHATVYKDILRPEFPNCEDFDVDHYLHSGEFGAEQGQEGPLHDAEWHKHELVKQHRVAAFERVLSLVEAAKLFFDPLKPELANSEPKGPAYIAIVIWVNKDGGKTEDQISRLKAGKPLF